MLVSNIGTSMVPVSRLDIDLQLVGRPEGARASDLDRLKLEMERILSQLDIKESLSLVWQPQASGRLAGEVKHQTVYIYVPDLPTALSTIRHEVVDYWLTQLLQAPLDWSDAAMQGLSDLISTLHEEVTLSPSLKVVIGKLAGLINLYTKAFTNTVYTQKEERVEVLCRLLDNRPA